MDMIFFLLFLLFLAGSLIALLKPSVVLWWSKVQTRRRFHAFTLSLLISFVCASIALFVDPSLRNTGIVFLIISISLLFIKIKGLRKHEESTSPPSPPLPSSDKPQKGSTIKKWVLIFFGVFVLFIAAGSMLPTSQKTPSVEVIAAELPDATPPQEPESLSDEPESEAPIIVNEIVSSVDWEVQEAVIAEIIETPVLDEIEPFVDQTVEQADSSDESPEESLLVSVKITKVLDAATFDAEVGGNAEKIRLDYIEIPEYRTEKPEFYSEEAYEYAKNAVEGKTVYIKKDYDTDKFGRLLSEVWIEPPIDVDKPTQEEISGNMLNAILIKEGYARVPASGQLSPLVDWDKFEPLQEEAKAANKGIWQKTGKSPSPAKNAPVQVTVYITRTGDKYHRGNCSYLRRSKIPISLGRAVNRGYEPCSRCRPPEYVEMQADEEEFPVYE
jgi:endonuclease YncB( thermonuclease family)